MWTRHRHEINTVLTDIVLPDGMSGRELVKRIQWERKDVRVIFTTGYSPEVAGPELQLREGINFVAKPWTIARLLEALRVKSDIAFDR